MRWSRNSFANPQARVDASHPEGSARETEHPSGVGRSLFRWVGVAGFAAYGFGMPAAIWMWLG